MGQVQIYSLGKRRDVRPPAESHPRPNQPPAWKLSTFWHPLAGRHCCEWSEIIHYLRPSFVTFPLKVATTQTGPTFGFWSLYLLDEWVGQSFQANYFSVFCLFLCGGSLHESCPGLFTLFPQGHCTCSQCLNKLDILASFFLLFMWCSTINFFIVSPPPPIINCLFGS